jgi:hypothetical protein
MAGKWMCGALAALALGSVAGCCAWCDRCCHPAAQAVPPNCGCQPACCQPVAPVPSAPPCNCPPGTVPVPQVQPRPY